MFRHSHVFLFFLSLITANVFAQDKGAIAKLQKDQMKIGQQIELKLSVHYREGSVKSKVIWPELKDTIMKNIEIVKADTLSTKLIDRASVLYEQAKKLTITSFDSGMYRIPPFIFIVDNDTVRTDTLFLYVATIPVDTTKPIMDIKGIIDVPAEKIIPTNPWPIVLYISLATLVVITGIILLIVALRKKKKQVPIAQIPMHNLLPHERILEELAELGRKKLWRSAGMKMYHIALTDILRQWIVERYGINAKEMTTGEILRALNGKRAEVHSMKIIEGILRNADMVKFAKVIPTEMDCENNLQSAIEYVQMTIYVPPPEPMMP
ncbi:MAG: hypothetical protein HY064_05490 [Bacteroidetes bacterium]|nr:hypothetical protein [Bacteroidota bacterium]